MWTFTTVCSVYCAIYLSNTPLFVFSMLIHPGEVSVLWTFSSYSVANIPSKSHKVKETKLPRFTEVRVVSKSPKSRILNLDAQTEASVISPQIISTKRQEITGYLSFPPHVTRSKLKQEAGSPTCMLHFVFFPTTRLFSPLYTE